RGDSGRRWSGTGLYGGRRRCHVRSDGGAWHRDRMGTAERPRQQRRGGHHLPVPGHGSRRVGHLLDINLRGVLLYCYHGGRLLRASKGGSIINITSQLAEIGLPERSVYCASKGGVKMFTRCLALDVAKFGIRVISIGPGVIRTAMSEARLKIPERLAWY